MDYELMMNGNVKIGQKAPDFSAETTYGPVSLDDYKGKWLVFFSHPGDFTPVCTTEMIAFARANSYFENINTKLLGLSIDSNPSHLEWMNDIYNMTGIILPFPIVADRNGEIARRYGMISNDVSTTETVRNVFIIDDKGVVRVILVYPLNVGRFIPEIIRIIQALQMSDCNHSSTPANWIPGRPVIMPPPRTFPLLQERLDYISQNNNGLNWYLAFEEPKQECLNQVQIDEQSSTEDDKQIKETKR